MPEFDTNANYDNQFLTKVYDDLAQFGGSGHERIEIRKDETGHFYPATAAKPRGITWLISLFYKPDTVREKKVAQFLLDFLKKNNDTIKETNATNVGNSLEQIVHSTLLDKLFEKIESGAQTWKHLKGELSPTIASMKEVMQSSLTQASKFENQAKEQYQQLVQSGEASKQAHIEKGQQEASALIKQAASTTTTNLKAGLRNQKPPKEDAISFACRDEGTIDAPLFIEAHKSVVQAYAEDPNSFFSGFFREGWKEKEINTYGTETADIEFTKDYPASTVNAFLDFLYGVPKTYRAENLQDLLGVLDLTEKFGLCIAQPMQNSM